MKKLLLIGIALMIIGFVGIFGNYYWYWHIIGESWSKVAHYSTFACIALLGLNVIVMRLLQIIEMENLINELTGAVQDQAIENTDFLMLIKDLREQNKQLRQKVFSWQGNFAKLKKKVSLLIITITLLSSCAPTFEQPALIKPEGEKVTIMFEQGSSDAEKAIMVAQMLKAKKKGINCNFFASHVKIIIDDKCYETHPKHGVIANTFDHDSSNTRYFVDYFVNNKQDIIDKLDYLDSTETEYYYAGVLAQLPYMMSGTWTGNREPTKFFCSKLVAYALDMPKYYCADMLDIYEYVSHTH